MTYQILHWRVASGGRQLKRPLAVFASSLSLCWAGPAWAQVEETEAPEAPPEAVAPAEAPMPAEEPSPTTEAPTPVEEAPPAPEEPVAAEEPVAEEAPPEEAEPESESKFSIGVGMRTGLAYGMSGPSKSQLSLNDGLVDQAHIRPYMSGTFNPHVTFFTQFEIGTPSGLGSFAILDAMAQLKVVDEFQVWVGQHIPANDRNNMNGPFFGNTWNFAIDVWNYPFDVGARDRGATIWGLVADGMLKYHLSVVDLQPGQEAKNARMAGRLTLHLLEPENFYYNSGTYFGSQDVLALGAVVQSQKGVAGVEDNDFLGFSLDAFFEKNTGSSGTFTVEGGYWNYEETGAGYVVNQGTVDMPDGMGGGIGLGGPYPGSAYMGVVSWLTPDKVGPGQIQPNLRVQYGDWDSGKVTTIDGGVAYVIDGFNHKYHLNFRNRKPEGGEADNVLQVGVQYLMGM